jgi:dolichyl-phosphate-mannose-protein mannosyltransferase
VRPVIAAAWALVGVVAVAATLMFYGLSGPPMEGPGYIHDECYQAFTAHRYAIGDPHAWRWGERDVMEKFGTSDLTSATTYEWVHPPLAKLIMAGFIRALGFHPAAYRAGSVVLGLLGIVVTFLLARRMFGLGVATLAAVLVSFDGMYFVLSRVAMNDIYVTGLLVACVGATYAAYTAQGLAARRGWALVSGLVAGLAIATKWNAAPTLIVCGLVVLWSLWRGERVRAVAVVGWVGAYVVIPAAVYAACYAPYLAQGYGLAELASLQRDIWAFHKSLRSGHSSSSRWYEWPLLVRPVWFYQADGLGPQTLREIYGFGNPLLWWLMFPAVIGLGVRAWRTRSVDDAFVVVPFLAVWLPWTIIGRVTFIQYVLPALPLGAIAVARVLSLLSGRYFARLAAGYGLAVVLCFAHFYPILVGRSVPTASVQGQRWFWFPGWRPCSGDCDGTPSASATADTAAAAEDWDDTDTASTATAADTATTGDDIELVDPEAPAERSLPAATPIP